MTARWIELLQQYRYANTVFSGLAAVGLGFMSCWYVIRTSRLPFLDRHRGAALTTFWSLVLVLALTLFTYLAFFWPKG
jgi:hypothetical protein